MTNQFFDIHCHLFSLQDVPVYATVHSTLRGVNTLVNLAAALAPGLFMGAGYGLKRLIYENEELVLSFDREPKDQLKHIVRQLTETPKITGHTKIICPLIMDFETEVLSLKNAPKPHKPVMEQLGRLKNAISANAGFLEENDCHILPFMGLDLRKVRIWKQTKFNHFWKQVGGLSQNERKHILERNSSAAPRVAGIKIYPPISDSPYPKNIKFRAAYLDFFAWCTKNRIPLTAHCQKSSYKLGRVKEIDERTSPKKWLKVLSSPKGSRMYPSVDLKDLTLNLAHFGGDEEIKHTIDAFHRNRLDDDTWTSTIVKILKRYPNTYSDISAFDFSSKQGRDDLCRIIELDFEGKLGNGYALIDKLLWGSDVPMVVSSDSYEDKKDRPHYKNLYYRFRQMINNNKTLRPKSDSIMTAMTKKNPKRFLHL